MGNASLPFLPLRLGHTNRRGKLEPTNLRSNRQINGKILQQPQIHNRPQPWHRPQLRPFRPLIQSPSNRRRPFQASPVTKQRANLRSFSKPLYRQAPIFRRPPPSSRLDNSHL